MVKFLLLLTLLFFGAREGLRRFERANLYAPDATLTILPSTFDIPYDDVTLKAADGTHLHGWYVQHPTGSGAPVVVIFHGNGGNISHRVGKLKLLRTLGFSVLLFDYRGYGRSAGVPSEDGTYQDGEAAARWLEAKGVPPSRWIFYGESLGGAVALETALRRPPAAVILEGAFTSTVAMAERYYPWLPAAAVVRYRYDNLAKIAKLTSRLLVMHSPEDEIVPFSMGEALFAAAPEPKTFLKTRGGHNDGLLDEYARELRAFLTL